MSFTKIDVLQNSKTLNIEQVLSLLIRGVERVSIDSLDPIIATLHSNYLDDIERQIEWPKLLLSHVPDHAIFKVHTLRSEFIKTNNVLTHIHKMLFVEQLKDKCYASKDYERVLDKIIVTNPMIDQYSIDDMVRYVKAALAKYIKIYGKESTESQLAVDILRHL